MVKTTIIGTAILTIFVIAGLLFYSLQSILPELDNRINYFDTATDMTQFVNCYNNPSCTPPSADQTTFENDKFRCFMSGGGSIYLSSNGILAGSTSKTGQADCITKKDFSRLKTYIKFYGGTVKLSNSLGNVYTLPYISVEPAFDNFEIIPDNLNIGTYDIYRNGEFIKRITGVDKLKIFIYTDITTYFGIDYIKFVPDDTYTIKNDEVWVKEVRGSSYSFADLNWEMIGYHSEIRPATIRDLTAQTEKPAPQIYINLINNLPVKVEPNTIHTFYYRTKWVQGLDSSCQGQLDKVEVKGSDGSWHCESYVKETPIIQQCQTKADCPILPECEGQKDLISCNNNLCDFTAFSPACKNQLITYQERVTEIENTKFVPIISGSNSFYCFFDDKQTGCNVGEKQIGITKPSYVCQLPSDSSTIVSTGIQPNNCWKATLSFLGNNYGFINNEINNNIGSNIKAEISMSASYDNELKRVRDNWGIAGKFTLPDNFLEIKPKSLGNKFVLQNSNEQVTFTITNNLGFGIDGGYSLLTTNTALEGGVVLRDETLPLLLKSGINDITYNFKTGQLGTIIDIIGVFGEIKTDREYVMKSSINDKEKFLVITKEVKTEIPADIEKVQPKVEIIERIVEKPITQEKSLTKTILITIGISVVVVLITIGIIWLVRRRK